MPPAAPQSLVLAFSLLVALTAAGFLLLVRRAGASPVKSTFFMLSWLAAVAGLAASGRLLDFDRVPPPLFLPVVVGGVITVALAFSSWGTRLVMELPLALLVGSQAFRLPLELVMHHAYEVEVMPVQMSYEGLNLDILTGATALILAFYPRRFLVWAWNFMGLALLINVVTIAILSTPIPIRVFTNEPANLWIATVPFCWLPTFLVPLALLGHLLVFRSLTSRPSAG
ncbi:MAG: hypothetical protein AMXMBFR33_73330 [Candidatus Xenobia bacterium]